jgi:hypothetical protein
MVYEGQFRKGKKIGYGRMVYADGSHFEGYFQNGLPHGKGKLTRDGGVSCEGNWNKGVGNNGVVAGQLQERNKRDYVLNLNMALPYQSRPGAKIKIETTVV